MTRSGVSFSMVLALVLAATPVWAGTTGKIAGTVTDAQTGEPLVPANIILEGTVLGGVSSDVGEYFIINVPPGSYAVTVKMIGYQDVRKAGIRVFPDFTTTVDFEMQQTAFELGEAIEVVEERPLIQQDRTASATFITAEDIEKLPIRGYQAAVSIQSGVVDFGQDLGLIDNSTEESRNTNSQVVRGGRPNQVGYFVDGFLQQDLLTGISSTSINNNAIEEVVFQKGGFEPEYGRFQSGIVNVITKEGGSDYFGSIEAITDNISGDWNDTPATDYNIYAGTFGGPLYPDSPHTMWLSGERRWIGDRAPSGATETMAAMARETLGEGTVTDTEQAVLDALENDTLPVNGFESWNWQAKLRLRVTDDAKLLVGTQGSIDDWQQYRHSYLFNQAHAPRYNDRNFSGFARFTQNLSAATFFNAAFNYFYTERKRGDGVHFDDVARYARPGGNPKFDQFSDLFFNVDDPGTPTARSSVGVITGGQEEHVFDDYLRRISLYWGLSGDVTRQVDRYNQVKIGGDFRRHALRRYQHFFPVNLLDENWALKNENDLDRYGFDVVAFDEGEGRISLDGGQRDGEKNPIEFSFYVQDKIEYEGLVVKGGVRYDYFDTDTPVVVDVGRPLDGAPDADGALEGVLDDTDLSDNETYHRVSPRIGVAFPVSQSTNVHFNYGRFFQPPTLENLYVSYAFLEHKTRTGGYFVDFGNPNLKPEETTAYEAGVAQAFGGGQAKFEVTAYYKTTKDLIQVRNIESLASSTKAYASYLNTDFGNIKGVDVDFTLRRQNRVAASFAYALSYAKGTGSIPGTQRDIAWTAGDPPKQTFPLDFDQRHRFTFNLDYRWGADDGPLWGGVHPFEDVGFNVLVSVASGTPYTPTEVFNEVTLANVAAQPDGSINSRYGPWTKRVDLKVDKGFQLGGTDWNAYVWILNVADTRNELQVYTSSGSATSTRFLATETGRNVVAGNNPDPTMTDADPVSLYNLKEFDPQNFGFPRQVRFGLRANF